MESVLPFVVSCICANGNRSSNRFRWCLCLQELLLFQAGVSNTLAYRVSVFPAGVDGACFSKWSRQAVGFGDVAVFLPGVCGACTYRDCCSSSWSKWYF